MIKTNASETASAAQRITFDGFAVMSVLLAFDNTSVTVCTQCVAEAVGHRHITLAAIAECKLYPRSFVRGGEPIEMHVAGEIPIRRKPVLAKKISRCSPGSPSPAQHFP